LNFQENKKLQTTSGTCLTYHDESTILQYQLQLNISTSTSQIEQNKQIWRTDTVKVVEIRTLDTVWQMIWLFGESCRT